MKQIAELRTDYICDQNLQHLDAFFTDDGMEQGITVAVVDLETGKKIFFRNEYRKDPMVIEALKEIRPKRKQMPDNLRYVEVQDHPVNDQNNIVWLTNAPDEAIAQAYLDFQEANECTDEALSIDDFMDNYMDDRGYHVERPTFELLTL